MNKYEDVCRVTVVDKEALVNDILKTRGPGRLVLLDVIAAPKDDTYEMVYVLGLHT